MENMERGERKGVGKKNDLERKDGAEREGREREKEGEQSLKRRGNHHYGT